MTQKNEDTFYRYLLEEIIDYERIRDGLKSESKEYAAYDLMVRQLQKVKSTYVDMPIKSAVATEDKKAPVSNLQMAFNAGIKCNQEHPDDDSYDQVHFNRVLDSISLPLKEEAVSENVEDVFKKHFGSIWSHQDFSAYKPYYTAAMQEYASLCVDQALKKTT